MSLLNGEIKCFTRAVTELHPRPGSPRYGAGTLRQNLERPELIEQFTAKIAELKRALGSRCRRAAQVIVYGDE